MKKEIDKNNVENSMVLKGFNRLLLIKNTLINFGANVHTFNEMTNNILMIIGKKKRKKKLDTS